MQQNLSGIPKNQPQHKKHNAKNNQPKRLHSKRRWLSTLTIRKETINPVKIKI